MQLKHKRLTSLINEMEPLGLVSLEQTLVQMLKQSNRNVISVGPGGVGLPDRDYYVSDADSKEKREKYALHVARMLGFLGEKPAEAKIHAEQILALEIAMSKPGLTV
jgi:endothelin-converting enzyme/putative endopeptidase